MELTATEREALMGIQAQEQLVALQLRERQAAILAAIGKRLRLRPDWFTTTHQIDSQTWAVVPVAVPDDEGSPPSRV